MILTPPENFYLQQNGPSSGCLIAEIKRIDHPLIIEKRARIKILLNNAQEDLPVEKVKDISTQVITKY